MSRKRNVTLGIVAASMGVSLAAAAFTYAMTVFNDDQASISSASPEALTGVATEPVSANESPVQVSEQFDEELPYVWFDASDPEITTNTYANAVTNLVNRRYLTGQTGKEDLINLVADLDSSVADGLDFYLNGLVDNLRRAKRDLDKSDLPYEDVEIGVADKFISGTSSPDETHFSVTVEFEYRLLSNRFDYLGPLIINSHRTEFIFTNSGIVTDDDLQVAHITSRKVIG